MTMSEEAADTTDKNLLNHESAIEYCEMIIQTAQRI